MQDELKRPVEQFFFEVGYAACFAEVMIRNDMKPPFELTDAHIEGAWPRSIEAHEDGAQMDHYLALASAVPALPIADGAEVEAAPWRLPTDEMPPLHNQVLVELREGPSQVCDVACYVGKFPIEGGGTEDRWIMADVRLDTRQIKRWAHIYPLPPRDEIAAAVEAAISAMPSRGPTFPEGEDGARECLAATLEAAWREGHGIGRCGGDLTSEDTDWLGSNTFAAFRGSGAMLPRATEDGMREACIRVCASLAAAISLLEKGGKSAKKAAASDRMFDQMLVDYRRSLDAARAALSSIPAGREGDGK